MKENNLTDPSQGEALVRAELVPTQRDLFYKTYPRMLAEAVEEIEQTLRTRLETSGMEHEVEAAVREYRRWALALLRAVCGSAVDEDVRAGLAVRFVTDYANQQAQEILTAAESRQRAAESWATSMWRGHVAQVQRQRR